MILDELINKLQCKIHTPEILNAELDIEYAYSSDLMSVCIHLLDDIDMNIKNKGMLISNLMTNQTVFTAERLQLPVILFTHGYNPSEKLIKLASDLGIIVLSTKHSMFTANGILHQNGINGFDNAIQKV